MTDFKYLSVKDLVETDSCPFTYGQLRGLLLRRNENGLVSATHKIGKRLYIRDDLFAEWMESHKENQYD